MREDIFKQDQIILNEENHQYKVKGAEHLKFTSATTFISQFFEKFDADRVAEKLSESSSGKYSDQSKKEILKSWDKIASQGTLVHNEIENWCNDRNFQPTHDKALYGIQWLESIIEDHFELYPEVRLFSIPLQLAGTIDLLIYNPERDLWAMVDWKTNKKITTSGYRGKKGLHHSTRLLEDCKLTKYTLQLSLYNWMLEEYYGIKIYRRMIVQLRENKTSYYPEGVKTFDTEYLKPNILKMIEHRKQQKENNELFKPFSLD